jgi:hypothetical protein
VDAAASGAIVFAGRAKLVSGRIVPGRKALMRMVKVKTCGSGTPTLVSSFVGVARAQPGLRYAIIHGATVARKPGHRGEHAICRKPLRGECRVIPRCLRCEYSCAYLLPPSAHEAAGALGTRHSPRPLLSEGERFWHSSGALRRENADVCVVIARLESAARRIASLTLAMTLGRCLKTELAMCAKKNGSRSCRTSGSSRSR